MRRASRPALPAIALTALLLASLSAGCGAHRAQLPIEGAPLAREVDALERTLRALDAGVDAAEARRVAETAIVASGRLAREYRVVPPAKWHNLLIQMGFRERGLCYHWTEDLMRQLQGLNLATLRLHWGVAHKGSDLREHNSVVVTAARQAFENGVVLDPWRNSGELFWAAVSTDSYPWRALPPEEW